MIELETKGNISSIISCIQKNIPSDNIWFRGQGNYQFKLIPALFRQGIDFKFFYDEAAMLKEFKRHFPNESTMHKPTFEWLSLMQHYGLPTRLLDWTSNLLVAIYFCAINDEKNDGSIYAYIPLEKIYDIEKDFLIELQATNSSHSDFYSSIIYSEKPLINDDTLINSISIGEIKNDPFKQIKFTHISSKEPFLSLGLKVNFFNTVDHNGEPLPYMHSEVLRAFSNVFPYRPPHLNDRIQKQSGMFTIHGGMYIDGESFIKVKDLETDENSHNQLFKIKIKKNDKKKLLQELNYLGINESSLFPEMEYQTKRIRDKHTNKMVI